MTSQPIGSFYSHHDMGRQQFSPMTLHEKMMLEAEPIIQHNWTDVAVHDKLKLKKIPVGHYCYWVVGKMGSYLSPAYCKLSDRSRWIKSEAASLAPIQILVSRWCVEAYKFNKNKHWLRFHDPYGDKHPYLVIKTDSNSGEVIPVDLQEFMELAVCKTRVMAVYPDA